MFLRLKKEGKERERFDFELRYPWSSSCPSPTSRAKIFPQRFLRAKIRVGIFALALYSRTTRNKKRKRKGT